MLPVTGRRLIAGVFGVCVQCGQNPPLFLTHVEASSGPSLVPLSSHCPGSLWVESEGPLPVSWHLGLCICREGLMGSFPTCLTSLVAQLVKNPPAMQETQVWSVVREDTLEKEMATHFSIFAWEIPWTEEPGGLQSMWLQESHTTRS